MEMIGQGLDNFLTSFFAPPNQLTLQKVRENPSLKIFAEYVEDLRADKARVVVLPCWRGGSDVDYYGLAFEEHDFRQLRLDLDAFVGCSYSTLRSRRASLNLEDPIDRLAGGFASGYVTKFRAGESDPAGSQRIAQKLQTLRAVTVLRRVRRPRHRLPLHMLLRDYYMALEAQNRTGAEKAIEEIRCGGLLDAVNLLFLRTLVVCRFGKIQQLEQSGMLSDLLVLRRPVSVTEALISLVYRTELARFEASTDIDGAIDHFKHRVLDSYRDFYRTWRGMRSAEAAKSFLISTLASENPDTALRDAILIRKNDFLPDDIAWIEALAKRFPTEVLVAERPPLANVDSILQSVLQAPVSLENLRVLCQCAALSDTLEVREAIRTRYAQLRPKEQQQLRSTRTAAAVLDELLQGTADNITVPLPQNWREWLKAMKRTTHWPKGIEIARRGATEWTLMDGNPDPQEFTELLLDVQERSELRVSIPHLITSARLDAHWPRPEWRKFYEAVMDVVASYTEGSVDDLTVWGELAEVLLQLGIPHDRYVQICNDAKDLWNANSSVAILDWAVEVIDTLLFYPCPDKTVRTDLFVAVASRAHDFKRLLEARHCTLLRMLASDFQLPEWKEAFDTPPDVQDGAETSPYTRLDGKMVAIYTLSERVSGRAKAMLEDLCPGVDVRINSDHVGTASLKNLAREADIFVVNTACAKHAATNFISANRKASAVTLFHNSRGTQSLLTLIERHL
jgi:hypothetical protein